MAKKTTKAELAQKYAKALLQEAIEHNEVDTVAQEMQSLGQLMNDSSEWNKLLTSRFVGIQVRKDGVALVVERAGLSNLTRNFLGVLIENGRTFAFEDIVRSFVRLYEEYKGVLSVSVVSAQVLNEQTQERLKSVLENIFKKDVRLNVKVDSSLIGGLTVQAGSFMADASVKTKLQKLNLVMKGVEV